MRAGRYLASLALLVAAPSFISTASASPADETEHVVLEGETLNGIANRAGVTPASIAEANGLEKPYVVRIGETLTIPRGSGARRTIAAGTAKTADTKTDKYAGLAKALSYKVSPGDTLGGIASAAGVPRILIAEANGIAPPYTIRVGQMLRIPRTGRHVVAAGETGFKIAMDRGVPWNDIAIANGLEPDAPLQPGTTLLIPTVLDPPMRATSAPVPASAPQAGFLWPIAGKVRRGYTERGSSSYHDGLDIRAPRGTEVRAAAAGKVIFAGNEEKDFGQLVVIDHGNGWHSAYGFLSRITVKQDAEVARGERIGLVGGTGRAKGEELHFEIRRDNAPVDPLAELPASP
ncbi:LysM peptidoglycan-binding domain-containing M23 family metallopeptidase [Novosphingobium aquimarinum]|uniref:LysM peptidoglycan-binding domain-containing M23 family metallopeptidase n=1 Tax=Novosphingobium aquimarinum TaxID=2682494 RepID=UPI0012EB521F|nr:LysM peptidoglycan-binding domain-containing M23 family metallopeptidase [Novosphingobium aquimarinum]